MANRQELLARAKELGVEEAYKKKNAELEELITQASKEKESPQEQDHPVQNEENLRESVASDAPNSVKEDDEKPSEEELEQKSKDENHAPVPLVVDVPHHVEIVEEVEPVEWPRTFGQQAVLYTDEASQVLRDEDDNTIHPLNRSYGVPELRSKKRSRHDDDDE